MAKKSLLPVFILIALPALCFAKRKYPETWYQKNWCGRHGGKTEIALSDKTRCDCLTPTHAIEFDFAAKWTEAVVQSLYYSLQTGKRAGIVLILEKDSDRKFWLRLNSSIKHFNLPIDTWSISANSYKTGR